MRTGHTSGSSVFHAAVWILLGWLLATLTSPATTLRSNAWASVGVADQNSESVFTASPDGKTVYMWQYFSGQPPRFLGKANAVLDE